MTEYRDVSCSCSPTTHPYVFFPCHTPIAKGDAIEFGRLLFVSPASGRQLEPVHLAQQVLRLGIPYRRRRHGCRAARLVLSHDRFAERRQDGQRRRRGSTGACLARCLRRLCRRGRRGLGRLDSRRRRRPNLGDRIDRIDRVQTHLRATGRRVKGHAQARVDRVRLNARCLHGSLA